MGLNRARFSESNCESLLTEAPSINSKSTGKQETHRHKSSTQLGKERLLLNGMNYSC